MSEFSLFLSFSIASSFLAALVPIILKKLLANKKKKYLIQYRSGVQDEIEVWFNTTRIQVEERVIASDSFERVVGEKIEKTVRSAQDRNVFFRTMSNSNFIVLGDTLTGVKVFKKGEDFKTFIFAEQQRASADFDRWVLIFEKGLRSGELEKLRESSSFEKMVILHEPTIELLHKSIEVVFSDKKEFDKGLGDSEIFFSTDAKSKR